MRKVFDNNEVIKNCNMSVKKGSIYGFLGRNGAGKTTVLKLIAGLLQPTSGTIKVSAKYCYITHELRLHQNDRCKRFTPV